MKILVTGATGYIGHAVAHALATREHEVLGLARSSRAAAILRQDGIKPVMGDFGDPGSLIHAVTTSSPDAVVSTASLGSQGGDAQTFARDRDAIAALITALGDRGATLVFTSGSAVFGVFANGAATDTVYDENSALPLPLAVVAPATTQVHPMLAIGLSAAMAARVDTERSVTSARGVRGIVIRPGLVYGEGGSYDLPSLIALARHHGRGVHLGAGSTLQSYVHIGDLAELYCLAIERAPAGATLHGATADVSQRDLAAAASRLIGAGGKTESLTMNGMLGLNPAFRAGLLLTRKLPTRFLSWMQARSTPPSTVGPGISLCLNKRLSSTATRHLLGWTPDRTDILIDVETGSYAQKPAER
jgi:nucleoside-diphosphate-sugar epimerase